MESVDGAAGAAPLDIEPEDIEPDDVESLGAAAGADPLDIESVDAGAAVSAAGAVLSVFFSQANRAKDRGNTATKASFFKFIDPSKNGRGPGFDDARRPGESPLIPVQREPGTHAPESRAQPSFRSTLSRLATSKPHFFEPCPNVSLPKTPCCSSRIQKSPVPR